MIFELVVAGVEIGEASTYASCQHPDLELVYYFVLHLESATALFYVENLQEVLPYGIWAAPIQSKEQL